MKRLVGKKGGGVTVTAPGVGVRAVGVTIAPGVGVGAADVMVPAPDVPVNSARSAASTGDTTNVSAPMIPTSATAISRPINDLFIVEPPSSNTHACGFWLD